ncbi:hypothetical protein TNCV_2441721 [Trichonephila clavipes]|nr:hypothetical protein TNCV_2441721 [Trichonephila clavipes]
MYFAHTAQWIPALYDVTGNEFADRLAKKGASIQQITKKAVPFLPVSSVSAERNSNKIWWNNLKDLPMWSRRKAVAEFCLTTRLDCLLRHLHIIHVAQAPFCTLCDFWEDMDADQP